jgi:hypothetical protein
MLPYRNDEEGDDHGVDERRDVADVAGDVVVRPPLVDRNEPMDDDKAEP